MSRSHGAPVINKHNQSNPDPKEDDMIDWWVGTVILTFFPTILSVIISLLRNGSIDFNRMIGDGELILSAFLVITPSIMNFFKSTFGHVSKNHKRYFYSLLFVAFIQLSAYICIKTNPINQTIAVYITSALCVLSSVIISRQGEAFLRKGNN